MFVEALEPVVNTDFPSMTSPTTRLVVGAALFVGLAAGLWAYFDSSGAERPPAADLQEPNAPTPESSASWPTDAGKAIQLQVDSRRGPLWSPTDQAITLTPFGSEASLDWRVHRTERETVVAGRGSLAEGDLRITWQFRHGDPQASLSMNLSGVSLETLRKRDVGGTLELPGGSFRASDGSMGIAAGSTLELPHRISAWEPAWLQWKRDDHRLALLDWTGDGMTIGRGDEGFEVTFELWRSKAHPALATCKDGDRTSPRLELTASATFQFGEAPTVLPARFPNGHRAAIAPIFGLPSTHPDTTLRRGAPDNPEDWTMRARTLAFGHSDTDDPRYGNGGLLGHGLGGTIVVPGTWADDASVNTFLQKVRHSGLDVATRGAPPEAVSAVDSAIGDDFSCASVVEADSEGLQLITTDSIPFRDELDSALGHRTGEASPALSPPSTPIASAARPFRLDGTRPQLLEDVLSKPNFDRLERRRGLATFSTPLLGTRNPLIPAAKEALLSPERHGQWTLAPPFAAALADLELSAEARPLAIASLAGLVGYWRRTRRVARRWNHDGQLLLKSHADKPIEGFTLVVDGIQLDSDQLSLDSDTRLTVRHTRHENGAGAPSPQSSISWDLAPETTYRLGFGDYASRIVSTEPVDWRIKGP